MYYFNNDLLIVLSTILNTKDKYVAAACNTPAAQFVYLKRHGNISLLNLIDLCNKFRVPVSYFIREEREEEFDRDSIVVKDRPWTPITTSLGSMGQEVRDKNGLTDNGASRLMGISATTFANYWGEEGRWRKITVQGFCSMCNNGKIYPGDIIHDENRMIAHEPKPENVIRHSEMEELKKENAMLRGKLKRLEERMEEFEEFMNSKRVMAAED